MNNHSSSRIDPNEYAWNQHERQLYIENNITRPTPYKIRILDDIHLRNQLELLLERLPQKELAIWARNNAERFLTYIQIGDEESKSEIISKTSELLQKRIDGELSAFELRKAGFMAHTLAKASLNDISEAASRVYAQAISVGHMRGHAIVSSDYAVKLINLVYKDNMIEVRKERNRQIELAREIAQ